MKKKMADVMIEILSVLNSSVFLCKQNTKGYWHLHL